MTLSATIRWNYRLLKALWYRYTSVPYATFPTEVPDLYSEFTVQHSIYITMRDGIRLCGDLYLPKPLGTSLFPTVLVRLPYGKNEYYCNMPAFGKYWAKKGYACFVQDVRGKHQSEGTWDPFVNETNDGYDTISWIAEQPWSNGKIAMTGESYFGYTCLAAAASRHPALVCIAPGVTASKISEVWVYNSGVHCVRTMGVWPIEMNSRFRNNFLKLDHWHLPLMDKDRKAGFDCPYYKDWLKNRPGSAYWNNIDINLKDVNIPILSWGGWYDTFLKGTIDDWQEAVEKGGENARRDSRLMITPIDHELTPTFSGKVGQISVNKNCFSYDQILRFFNHHIRARDSSLEQEPPVTIFTVGKTSPSHLVSWPPPDSRMTPLYLGKSSDSNFNILGESAMESEDSCSSFEYNPADPVAITLSSNPWRIAEFLKDRKEVEERTDVVCFTGRRLENDLEVTGKLSLALYASSSAPDTDFTATLVDVFPDGSTQLVQEGIVRARYRNQTDTAEFLTPGAVYLFQIDMWHVSYVFPAGHQIRVEVSSSNFSRYDRNLNSNAEYFSAVTYNAAQQTIYHSATYPSHLLLPIRLPTTR